MLVSRCLLLLRSRSSASLLLLVQRTGSSRGVWDSPPSKEPHTGWPRWLLWLSVDSLELICCSASLGVFQEQKLAEKICPFSALVLLE